MNRAQAQLASDTRAAAKLTLEQREEMVERFLRGESKHSLAEAFGVDPSLPSLRAYTWGFTDRRYGNIPNRSFLTDEGRAWLDARQAARTPDESGAS